MRAERIVLRAKHLAVRKNLERMINAMARDIAVLKKENHRLSQKLAEYENNDKLVRPATMAEASRILVQ